MEELECMHALDESVRALEDESARSRVVGWLAAKYLGSSNTGARTTVNAVRTSTGEPKEGDTLNGQIPGIAKLSQSGELLLTVRDFKAKSANDAAVRLVHVVLWAAAKLTGESGFSSKNFVVPLLRKYRCYDGNTRSAIAADKGLVRDGDLLSLDFHAEQYAQKIVDEILDTTSEGRWKPSTAKRRTVRNKRDGMGAA
jgi:hypothetical protein